LENAAVSLFFDNFGDSVRGAVNGLGSSVDRSLAVAAPAFCGPLAGWEDNGNEACAVVQGIEVGALLGRRKSGFCKNPPTLRFFEDFGALRRILGLFQRDIDE
jgi:hypothetical protein